MAIMKVASVVFVIFMVVAPIAEAKVSCDFVSYSLGPCIDFLFGDSSISTECCDGVKDIDAAAATTVDRQANCNCLKKVAYNLTPTLDERNGAIIFKECGVVNSPYEISIYSECNMIKAKEVVADARLGNILTTM